MEREYLERCVIGRWKVAALSVRNDKELARIAVDEVIEALSANPAWLPGFNIGPGRTP